MSTPALLARFAAWRAAGTPLALATVISTTGSTYAKAGHRMLIAGTGDYHGLVSGGCLEQDLALHARQVIDTGEARVVTYDLASEADQLFGLGVGCDGALRILLQRLGPEADYAPFAGLAAMLEGDEAGACALVAGGPAAGSTLVVGGRHRQAHGLDPEWVEELARRCAGPHPLPRLEHIPVPGHDLPVLFTALAPIPRLLLLGAGPDAVPVLQLGHLLGWRVTVLDHRPAYLERLELAAATERLCAPAGELAGHIGGRRFAAAVVMSHHLATDRSYLAGLADSAIPYIGLLGPRARRERLLRELGPLAARLVHRLHGPAGLAIGADSPESIALAIWAQIQAQRAALPVGVASATSAAAATRASAGLAADAAPAGSGNRERP